MSLTTTNAQIAIQDASGAVVNLTSGNAGTYRAGDPVTFSLQSTTGVQKWTLQFVCPAYPSLHLVEIDWVQGQANSLFVQMPSGPAGSTNKANGIQVLSTVSDGASSIAQAFNFLQTLGGNGQILQHKADYVMVAALPAYTNVSGVLTGNSVGAITSSMADGATPAVGDTFLLEQGIAATAADVGIYQISVVGSGAAKFVAVRLPEMAQGSTLLVKTEVLLSFRGTVFGGVTFVCQTGGTVGTTSTKFFARSVTASGALTTGVATIGASNTANFPAVASIMSASLTQLIICRLTQGGTTTSTVQYVYNGAPTVGGIGTGAISGMAAIAAGTVEASDTSVCTVTYVNPL